MLFKITHASPLSTRIWKTMIVKIAGLTLGPRRRSADTLGRRKRRTLLEAAEGSSRRMTQAVTGMAAVIRECARFPEPATAFFPAMQLGAIGPNATSLASLN
jgi:hypothetical protein